MRTFCTIVMLLFVVMPAPALAERRVALVIGNSAYEYVPQLANPKNDATDMAAKLEDLGFEVVRGEDLDLMAMRGKARDFIRKLDGADLSLFFYAGHGLQVSGSNYMAPVDSKLASIDDLDFEALPMDLILVAMERKTKVNLVFLDACRDNPLAENLSRSMGTRSSSIARGLAKLETGVGSLIAFATQPGNVALDGEGRNSPFTAALLKHLGTPGQSITDDLIQVRRDVLDATQGKQVPWENSSLTGPVVLNAASNAEVNSGSAAAAETKSPDTTNNAVEIAYWNAIKDASEPRLLEAYLKRYPQGDFADLARIKIDMLSAAFELEKHRSAVAADADGKAVADASPKPNQEAKAIEVVKLEQPSAPEAVDPEIRLVDPVELALTMQIELSRIGCLVGQPDGKWGPGSRRALEAFAENKGLKITTLEPTNDALREIMATQEHVCPSKTIRTFDGAWELSRRAGNKSCDYVEQSTLIFIDGTDVSAIAPVAGTLTGDGSLDIYLSFIDDDGASRQNHIIGKLRDTKGSGHFTRVGSTCAGAVVLRKRVDQ